ncbi:MFS transporter [Rhodococcus spelaei]|uniref:MFS transporter n=1 Tax=Rhodococcus spelaei TaxID=2546320 RepID=A0A541BNV0_9NOCA|nr:MFS transporter [Rhodococcus spelaei]TQF74003.1 MFS transporter [Rhodococcus spelaei]
MARFAVPAYPHTPVPQRWPARTLRTRRPLAAALAVIVLNSTLQAVDPQLNAVAMPAVAADFGLDPAASDLLRSISTIALAACMLGVAILGDLKGRKLILVLGGAGVAAAAVTGAAATNEWVFGAGRVLMGVSTAMSFAMVLAFLPALFSDRRLVRAFSVWLVVDSVAIVLIGVAGGLVQQQWGWRCVYLLTGALALVSTVAAALLLPENRAATSRRFDTFGVVLAGVGLVALIYSLSQGSARGWGSPVVLGGVVIALVVLTTFVWWEAGCANPGFPVGLFAAPAFAGACLVGLMFNLANGAIIGQFPAMAIPLGHTDAGVAMVASLIGVGSIAGATASGFVMSRYRVGPRTMFVSGLLVLAVGLASQIFTAVGRELAVPGFGVLVVGFGIMWMQNPQSAVVAAAAPPGLIGTVGSVKPAVGQLGMGLGLGVAGPVAALLTTGEARTPHAYGVGMLALSVLFVLAALAVAFLMRVPARRPPTAAAPVLAPVTP